MLKNKTDTTSRSQEIIKNNYDALRNYGTSLTNDIADFAAGFVCSPEIKPKLVRVLTKEVIYLAGEQLKAELYYNSERILKG